MNLVGAASPTVALSRGLPGASSGVFAADVAALATMAACLPTLALFGRKRRYTDLVSGGTGVDGGWGGRCSAGLRRGARRARRAAAGAPRRDRRPECGRRTSACAGGRGTGAARDVTAPPAWPAPRRAPRTRAVARGWGRRERASDPQPAP